MLTRCARTVRRTRHCPVYVLLQSRQFGVDGTTVGDDSHAADQVFPNSSGSISEPTPWECDSINPSTHVGKEQNIFLHDLEATVSAHQRTHKRSSQGPFNDPVPIRKTETATNKLTNWYDLHIGRRKTLLWYIKYTRDSSGILHRAPQPSLRSIDDREVRIDGDLLLKERPVPSTLRLEEEESKGRKLKKLKERSERQHKDKLKDISLNTGDGTVQSPLCEQWAVSQNEDGGKPQRPWLSTTRSDTRDAMQRLNGEIKAFEGYMMLTQAEKRAAEATTTLINAVAKKCCPGYKITFHGSRCTGLAMPYSDIDVALGIPQFEKPLGGRGPSPSRPEGQKSAETLLKKVYWNLCRRPTRVPHVEMIHARIPLVVAYDAYAKIKIQFMALTPVRSSLEFTAYYLSEYPSLRPLFFILRQALEMRSLNSVKDGGLGSYPLFMMIMTALNHDTGHIPKDDVASQLLHVLKFWSDADLSKNGYAADPPRVFPKTRKIKMPSKEDDNNLANDPYLRGINQMSKYRPDQPFLLCLQDPGDPVNDLGKKTYLIRQIQALFRFAHGNIMVRMKEWEDTQSVRQRREWGKSMLDSLVKGAYGKMEAQRKYVADSFSVSTTNHSNLEIQ